MGTPTDLSIRNSFAAWMERHEAARSTLEARVRAEVIEEAKKVVTDRADSYDEAHGSYDPSTGVTEYPGDGAEWMGEWEEIAEDIDALHTPASRAAVKGGAE